MLAFPFADPPAAGTTCEVAPGVYWLRMPLPFALDHINLWLLEDERDGVPGFTIIDCGLANDPTRAAWQKVFAGRIGEQPVHRLIVTHFHPDHAGLASWLIERFGCGLWMTQGEYLTAHAVYESRPGYSPEAARAFYRANGLDAARDRELAARGHHYRRLVLPLPDSYQRMLAGDTLSIGRHAWKVMVGHGHAPEHASLYCAALGVCISGDMLLPKISTNVSVWASEPEGNPLALFLASIRDYLELPPATLILPSHGLPFRGAHRRVAALEQHHAERLAELERACADADAPLTACDVLGTLFRRTLDVHQTTFAMGEAVAHLNYLYSAGRLSRTLGADGIVRYAALKVLA